MKNIILGILLLLLAYQSRSQDVNSSQFYSIPSNINPAFTGFINNDYMVAASYKNQWSSVASAYQTVGATAQLSLLKNKKPSSIIGVGLDILHDRAGEVHFNTTSFNLNVSYLQVLDRNYRHILGFGIQNGMSLRKFDMSRATFGNQFNGYDGFDGSIDPLENGINPKQIDYNLAVGGLYSYAPKAHTNLYVSFSAFNLIRPNVSFYHDQENRLYRRFAAMVGGEVVLKGTWSLLPSAIYQKQGPNYEIMFGSFARYGMQKNNKENFAINFGLWYRYMDAIIPAIKMEYKGLNITVNYDINVSKLTKASKFNGTGEISISYSGLMFKEHKQPVKPIFCPTMSF
ncbi:MAG: PorP/SprF family type IX secretion system membrane protein [Chitinophagales bacterium]|nr:PorP/SprF family type IX secretion system membrane protein [Bacteroidota bacterium]